MNSQNKNSHTDKTKNKTYTFVQRENDDFTCLKLLSDEYKDVVFKYGKVGFAKDEDENGNLPMRFDYDILQNPNNKELDTNEFVDHIGDILVELMEKQIKDGTAIIK